MTYSYSQDRQKLSQQTVRVTGITSIDKDIDVSFSDTLRDEFYKAFIKQISEICEDLRIIFYWRPAYDSVRIHLPRNTLQDIVCAIKNFLQKFSFAHAT